MSPFARIASIPVASAAAVGLVFGVVVAPPAVAEPCTGAAAEAQPPAAPNTAATPELPGVSGPPIGHRPRKANDSAPLPNLGRLSRSILNSVMPQSGRVQQQAGVAPPAPPPPVPTRRPSRRRTTGSRTGSGSGAATGARPAAGHLARRLGHRPTQPQRHHQALRDHRHRPRNHVGQRRSREQPGADGLRRHPTGTAACAASSGGTTRCSVPATAHWRRRSRSRTALSTTSIRDHPCGRPRFQAGRQQHQVRAFGDGHHSDIRHRDREDAVHELHVDQELGQPRPVVDELLGDRGLARQRRALGRLPAERSARIRDASRESRMSPGARIPGWGVP